MEPPATPPWRVLDAPSPAVGASVGSAGAPAPQSPGPSGLPLATVKAVGIGAGAIACAIAAFLIASGDGEASVRIDGATTLPIASDARDPAASSVRASASAEELVVEIDGAVTRPGVYRMPLGSRIGELVAAAGGYGPRVDTDRAERELNLASALHDGDEIRVPSRDDVAGLPASPAGTAGAGPAAPLDLNTATQAELETLPGIGPATALKIIAAREEAPFAAVEELRSRAILGEKTYEKVRDLVAVR